MPGPRAAALIALAFVGCWYPAERGRLLEARLDRMQEENAALHRGLKDQIDAQKKALDAQVPRIEAKIREVEAALAGLDKAARRSSADVGVQVEKLIQDTQSLRGQVEQYLHRIEMLDKNQAGLDKDLSAARDRYDKKVDDLEKALEAFKTSAVGQELAQKARMEKIERPADKKEFLDLARKHLAEDKALGRALVKEWFNLHAADPLAAEAHFLLAESYEGDKRCREALGEFGEIIKSFPKYERAGEALLRSSACFGDLKMDAEARIALDEVVKSYPKTDAAKRAQKKIDELRAKEKKQAKKK